MIDVVFEIGGDNLPNHYPYSLWEALVQLAPQLGGDAKIGVVPLRLAEGQEGMTLPKRIKMVLRVPQPLIDVVSTLQNKQLSVAGSEIHLGACKTKEIQHFPTLHAHLVTGAEGEAAFMAEIESALAAMSVKASLICGQHRSFSDGKRTTKGYSLVLHDLTPEGSIRVQCAGLGSERHFGCGIFVPYKVISSFE